MPQGEFSGGDTHRYRALVDKLLGHDSYLLMADFADYVATQLRVDALYQDPAAWNRRAILQRGRHGLVLVGPHDCGLRRARLVGEVVELNLG